jgi:hypothetical protein
MTVAPYRLSFTTGGLFINESTMAADLYSKSSDWQLVRDQIRSENLLQVRTAAAALRISKEVVARLEHLSSDEIVALAQGSVRERGYLLWAAVCRRYAFIREFATEVLREYFITLRQSLALKDFDAFFNGKAMWHEELDKTAVTTQMKLRQNLFRMMREADLISEANVIQPAILSNAIASLLAANGRDALLIFPISDSDIDRCLQ